MHDSLSSLTVERTALLLLDLQPMTLGAIADAERVVASARRALVATRSGGVACMHVRVAFTPDDHARVPAGHAIFGELAVARGACEDSPETELVREVAPIDGEPVFTKTRVSAFTAAHLDEVLRTRRIDTLVIAGVVTSGAVLSTVLEASDRDYRVVVLRDACADFDPGLSDALLESVLQRHASVVEVDDLVEWVRREAPSPN